MLNLPASFISSTPLLSANGLVTAAASEAIFPSNLPVNARDCADHGSTAFFLLTESDGASDGADAD
jgi:hypothetical protein